MATEIAGVRIGLTTDLRNLEAQFNRAGKSVDRFGNRADRRLLTTERRMTALTTAATRLRTAVVGGLGALGVGIGGRALVRGVRDVVSEFSELGKQARSVGLTAEALQELRFGFGQAGIEAGELNRALDNFAQRIGQAIEGSGRLGDALERNGIALRDQNGEVRGTLDLMRDYADVVARAESEQEAMNLAALAFGDRAGRRMVRALRDGSAGVDELMQRARDAGVVIGEDLVDAAERVDDRFDKLTQQIGTGFKTAVLASVDAMDQLIERFRSLEDRSLMAPLQAEIQALHAERDALNASLETHREILRHDPTDPAALQAMEAHVRRIEEIEARTSAVFNRIGELNQRTAAKNAPRPGVATDDEDDDTDSRRRSTVATREQRDAAEELIRALDQELALVSATDAERMVANNLRMAGADATEAQRARVVELTEALIREEEAQLRAAESANFFGDIAMDSFRSLAREIQTGNDLLDKLIARLIDAAAQAALFGSGPLAGLFGRGGGGLIGGPFTLERTSA